ncbi:hypothetical protein AYI68_g5845 [Smittium mucronatum]|uniref:Uncharacterized protein n=1 Tax=Smittium mucronatum TaxID=133383 RepID=A0A1R0GT97_9FUNG|nr:hypothetical protein AYI68_g5845 [Smittium mucronatum]
MPNNKASGVNGIPNEDNMGNWIHSLNNVDQHSVTDPQKFKPSIPKKLPQYLTYTDVCKNISESFSQ